MKKSNSYIEWNTVKVSAAAAARVFAAAARVGLTREQARAIAKGEPRGVTALAGKPEDGTQADSNQR